MNKSDKNLNLGVDFGQVGLFNTIYNSIDENRIQSAAVLPYICHRENKSEQTRSTHILDQAVFVVIFYFFFYALPNNVDAAHLRSTLNCCHSIRSTH